MEKLMYSYDLVFTPKVRKVLLELDEMISNTKKFKFLVQPEGLTFDQNYMIKAAGFNFDWDKKVWLKNMTRYEYLRFNKFLIKEYKEINKEVSNDEK